MNVSVQRYLSLLIKKVVKTEFFAFYQMPYILLNIFCIYLKYSRNYDALKLCAI